MRKIKQEAKGKRLMAKEDTIEELEHRLDSFGIGWLDFISAWKAKYYR